MVSDQASNAVIDAVQDAIAAERVKLFLKLEELNRGPWLPSDKLDGLFSALSELKGDVGSYAGIHVNVAPENGIATIELRSTSSAQRYTISGKDTDRREEGRDEGHPEKLDFLVREYTYYFFASTSSSRITPCDSTDEVMRLVTEKIRKFIAVEYETAQGSGRY